MRVMGLSVLLKELKENIQDESDYEIERQIKKYEKRAVNICMKYEDGQYSEDQFQRNGKRCNVFLQCIRNEQRRRLLEIEPYYRRAIASMQNSITLRV